VAPLLQLTQHEVEVPQALSLAACKSCLTCLNQRADNMATQTPTSVTTHCHHNEHLLLSMVDRTYQLNHINHILIKVVLFITEIHLAKPATLVLVLISQVLTVKCLNNLDHMVNQLSQWAAPYLVNH
jgi:hypothetical protein